MGREGWYRAAGCGCSQRIMLGPGYNLGPSTFGPPGNVIPLPHGQRSRMSRLRAHSDQYSTFEVIFRGPHRPLPGTIADPNFGLPRILRSSSGNVESFPLRAFDRALNQLPGTTQSDLRSFPRYQEPEKWHFCPTSVIPRLPHFYTNNIPASGERESSSP